jgi:hypothetical protein
MREHRDWSVNRRIVFGAVSGALLLGGRVAAAAGPRTFEIESPDDVFIDDVASDGPVAANQKLFALTSPALERLQSRLQAFQSHLDVVERPLNDGRVDAAIKSLKAKADSLTTAATAAADQVTYNTDLFESSGHNPATMPALDQARMQAASVTSIYSDTILQAAQADQNLKDMKDRLQIAKDQLSRAEAYLTEMRNRMTIVAPQAATFASSVLKGSFVKKGHILGSLAL